MGRWTLVALTLNSVIGSGIYGVPGETIRLVGAAAPLATLVAAAGIGAIMACFAEVGSQFRQAGGVYLYAREAFGRLAGIQMGWMALLVRVTAHAAIANLFVTYVGEFVPGAVEPVPRIALLVGVLGILAAVNVVGVASGARLSNIVSVVKLLPLVAFCIAGLWLAGSRVPVPVVTGTIADWTQAVLLLIFAFGGFEAALIPMAEAENPRRDIPIALGIALGVCTVLYAALHLVVLAVPGAAATARPVAEAARALAGPPGALLMAAGATLSILGILSAGMLNAPRLLYALAVGGDVPRAFAAVHPRFRTPWVSILTYAALTCALAMSGGFVWNAVLSAVGRLFTYGAVCLALLRLRQCRPDADAYRVTAGPLFAAVGLLFCVALVTQMRRAELVMVASIATLALAHWRWVTRVWTRRPRGQA
jgi:amino acid transporter